MPEAAFFEKTLQHDPQEGDGRRPAKVLSFPSNPDLSEAREREKRITAAIEQYARVFEKLVRRMTTVLEIQEERLRNDLKEGASKAVTHDEEELARVRAELEAVRAIAKAMKS